MMEVSPKSQIVELIRNASEILVVTHADPDGDALGSALATRRVLAKLKKKVDLVVDGHRPSWARFLPDSEFIKESIPGGQDITITIDTSRSGDELKLGQKKLTDENRVIIAINSINGSLTPEDITIESGRSRYDLVIFLDCSNFDRVGDIKDKLDELILAVPTVSIDHHASNGFFAKVNWVDTAASATAEMLVSLFEALGRGENLLDPETATLLFTGILTDTSSFQNTATTSKSLTVAAQLVAAGAKNQEIIDKIYRSKPLSTLKLWGRVLAHAEQDDQYGFCYSYVSNLDAAEVGADPQESAGLIDELFKSTEGVRFVLLLSERGPKIHGSLRSVEPNYDVAHLASEFGGGGHTAAAAFQLEGTLELRQEEILARLRAKVEPIDQPLNIGQIF